MLLSLKEDYTIGSFNLCCLLCVFSVIIKSGVIFTNVHLYTIILYVQVVWQYLCVHGCY